MVINLTYNKKLYFKSLFSSLLISLIFIAAFCGFYKNEVIKTEEKTQKIPYYSEPESIGIIIKYDDNEFFIGLDFAENATYFIFDNVTFNALSHGFKIDYSYTLSQETLEALVDYLGGIEVTINSENLNLTGNQVRALLSEDLSYKNLKITAENISEKIAEEGISDIMLEELFENNLGTLTLKTCYLFYDDLDEVFKNTNFIE